MLVMTQCMIREWLVDHIMYPRCVVGIENLATVCLQILLHHNLTLPTLAFQTDSPPVLKKVMKEKSSLIIFIIAEDLIQQINGKTVSR